MVALQMGPATVDLNGVRAHDRNALFVALTSSGSPLNLTGQVVTAQARSTADAAVAVDGVIEGLVPAAGTFTLRWPGDQVAALFTPPATKWAGVWDLQIQATGADPVTVMAGKFNAELDVTRPAG